MRDLRFVLQMSALVFLIGVALVVLNFLDSPHKSKKTGSDFLIKLSKLDESYKYVEFRKLVKKSTVVVVEKEIQKETPQNKVTSVVRNNINHDIKPARESVIDINPVSTKKRKKDGFSKLVAKFHRSHDFKLALKISRLYYASKRYKKSLKWAMIANQLNQKDDSSWILFAKTKIKLGDKEDAKKALLTYDSVYNSKRVKQMLVRMSS